MFAAPNCSERHIPETNQKTLCKSQTNLYLYLFYTLKNLNSFVLGFLKISIIFMIIEITIEIMDGKKVKNNVK